ncbi:transcriptional regulator, XRE family [Lachnospiraceae bacterium KM106-2]|nr:transcriptional regulator, XRE family [Lachnospiraceae bacterium KM106-2]
MKINETIRKYRKEKNLTQEQIANQLGVSAPAVNKWENGISYPDIELLAPLARLLEIDIDTLLSFREELTEKEIAGFINQLSEGMIKVGFEESYRQAEQKIREFPNCYKLILWSAQVLNGYLVMKFQDIKEKENYQNQIMKWFEKVAFCDEAELAKAAQISLAQYYMNSERYEEAQKILDKIPPVGFDKRTTQVQLLVSQSKYDDAYRIQDEMLYQQANGLINNMMHTLSMLCKQKKQEDAIYYADMINQMEETFQLGCYIGSLAYFTVYAEMGDKDRSMDYLEKMMDGLVSMRMPKTSRLYQHMKFNEDDGLDKMKEMIVKSFDTDKSFDFIRKEPRYQALVRRSETKK